MDSLAWPGARSRWFQAVEDGATGIAVAAFVDADTGQPMAVIHDIPVYNPHQSALSGNIVRFS